MNAYEIGSMDAGRVSVGVRIAAAATGLLLLDGAWVVFLVARWVIG